MSYWEDDPSDPAANGKCLTVKELSTAGSGLSWAVSTLGFNDISVSLDIKRMNATAPQNWVWMIDTGTGYSNYANATVKSQIWEHISINLSSEASVNNNSSFKLKLVIPTDLTYTGNISFDYVLFTGTVVPEPATASALVAGAIGFIGSIIASRKRKMS